MSRFRLCQMVLDKTKHQHLLAWTKYLTDVLDRTKCPAKPTPRVKRLKFCSESKIAHSTVRAGLNSRNIHQPFSGAGCFGVGSHDSTVPKNSPSWPNMQKNGLSINYWNQSIRIAYYLFLNSIIVLKTNPKIGMGSQIEDLPLLT